MKEQKLLERMPSRLIREGSMSIHFRKKEFREKKLLDNRTKAALDLGVLRNMV